MGQPTLQKITGQGNPCAQSIREFPGCQRWPDKLVGLHARKEAPVKPWSIEDARHTYGVAHWAEGFFDINEKGDAIVLPKGLGGPQISLPEVLQSAHQQGLRSPLLVRFTDILGSKLARLQQAFAKAAGDWQYTGGYTAIFPIKVNQQQSVVSELVAHAGDGFGLEAGSKPELMAVLAMNPIGQRVICNGYKDREYIRLALIGIKLGMKVFIVIEKANELDYVIEEAKALGVKPNLGVRMRLASLGAGKWQNTGGDKAKFGLLPTQLLKLSSDLKAAGLSDCLQLLHFHMGSQISNVRDIAGGMREAVRYFVELHKLGHPITHIDTGGGLAVDYEGTRSRSFCSMNYGLPQYASSIVGAVFEACAAHGIAHPRILTEAGRAMTAHHAVLIADVTAIEKTSSGNADIDAGALPSTLRHLKDLYDELDEHPPHEAFQEAQYHQSEGHSLFALGQLSLQERAQMDELYYAVVAKIRANLREDNKADRELREELNDKLSDKYFCNFSVFQSVPDVWALEQVFPILPINRHLERPTRRGVLEDLTCDSDGRIDHYVDSESIESSMPVHDLPGPSGAPYYLALFMVGAYQETLGDMHNLFGDTDSVNVRIKGDSWVLEGAREGDSTEQLLKYVGYDTDTLRRAYRARIQSAGLIGEEAKRISEALESGLTGYTYLS
jgi:arginine decarboxylase